MGARANLVTNGGFTNGLTAWSTAGNVTNAPGLSLTRDGTNRSTLFQTVQQQGLPLDLSFDFYYAVLSDSVPPGLFADTAYFSIYESSNALTLRPDLDQFDKVSPVFDASFSGFTNLMAGVSVAPSPRGPDWWAVSVAGYVATYDFVAPTLEVYNFNGVPNDSTAPMTDVVMNSVPEPGTAALLLSSLLLALVVRKVRSRALLLLCLALTPAVSPARAQAATPLGSRVRVATANETSSFDRSTRIVTQTADVTLTNTGDRPVKAPLRVRIALAGEGDLGRVNLGDVVSGDGDDARPYRDLSALLPPAGLAPGASVQFALRITRPFDVAVSYQLEAQGVFNRDPSAAFDAPLAAVAGEEVSFDASASDDGDGGKPIAYAWNFGDGGTADAVSPKRIFARPGRYDVALTLTDEEGAKAVLRKTISILPSANFAVARTRTLDSNGQPIGDVTVQQRMGTEVTESISDASSGFAALGGEPGEYVWRFSRDGYLPAWRKASLGARQILFVPSPWLVRESAKDKQVSPLRELVLGGANEPATITFAAGAFAAEGAAGFTAIGPQALPLPLPAGWSPLGAFHIALPSAPSQGGIVAWVPSDKLGADDALAMLNYDANLLQWTVVSLPSPGASPAGEVDEGNTYALVVADKGARAPPSAQLGAALPAATDISVDSSTISATGSVNPAKVTASRQAAAMTAAGRVVFTSASDLPSGTFFRTEIEETYNLAGGRTQRTPVYDTSFFAYQRPGDSDDKTLHAAFPLRPARLIAPEQIDTAQIEAVVLTGDSYAASLFDQTGGRIAAENLAVSAEDGDLSGRSLAELRLLDIEGFQVPLSGRSGVAAFQLSVANLAPGRGLEVELSGLAPNSNFVVARYVAKDDEEGFEPVERLRSDGEGVARSLEPDEGVRLPGVTGPGQFVVVAVDEPQAVVSGVARTLAGEAVAGLAVRIAGLPWLTFSAAGGAYKLVAPQGATSIVAVVDPADGNTGSEEVAIAAGADAAAVDVRAATTAPRVANVFPADGAQKVRAATPVKIRFSEPIDAATFGPDAMTLTNPLGVLIQGSISLNPAGTEATFLPTNPLEHAATYTIELSAGIRDRQGLPLEGARLFSFSVVPFFERAPGAQLVIYEPGAENIPQNVQSMLVGYSSAEGSSHVVAHGSAGTADPEVPVILVNQNTGETATVLSKLDGSFGSFINAAEEDFIQAVFVNASGTRVTIPATRQLFDDGRIGLYRYGGILEAESDGGSVQIIVEPEAIRDRNVFKVERLFSSSLLAMLNGVLPAGDSEVVAGAKIEMEGDPLQTGVNIVLPTDQDDLGLPDGISAETASFALTQQIEMNGQIVYEMMSDAVYETGALRTTTPVSPTPQSQSPAKVAKSVPGRRTLTALNPQFSGGPIAVFFLKISNGGRAVVTGRAVVRGSSGLPDAPVPGAIITWQEVGLGGGRPLGAGDLVAVADENGGFRLIAPISLFTDGPLLLNGYSPRFPEQVGTGGASGLLDGPLAASTARVFFTPVSGASSPTDTLSPKILLTLADPVSPPAADKPFTVVISADDDSVPPSLEVKSPAFFTLLDSTVVGFSRRNRYSFLSPEGVFRITSTATDESGNKTTLDQDIKVAAVDAGTARILVDADDQSPPFVVGSFPGDGTTFVPFTAPIQLTFSEPINSLSLSDLANGAVLSPSAGVPDVQISSDNTIVSLRYPLMQLGRSYTLTLSPHHYRDLAGNEIDQDGVNARYDKKRQPFAMSFRSVGQESYNRLRVEGGGIRATGNGEVLFALDRNPASLATYTVVSNGGYSLSSVVSLPDSPRDIIVVDDYDLVLPKAGGTMVVRDPIVVVCGGEIGGFEEGGGWSGTGPWVLAFRCLPDGSLTPLGRVVFPELGPTLFMKLAYDRGKLGIQTSSPEDTSVQVLDLQSFLWAMSPVLEAQSLPARKGADVNSDGDYGDVNLNEIFPVPASEPRFGFLNRGLFLSLLPPEKERLEDFDLALGGRLVCAVTREPLTEKYRLRLLASGGVVRPLDESAASFILPQRAKRVKALFGVEVLRNGEVGFADLILVSSENKLLIYEYLGDKQPPRLVNEVVFPGNAGVVQSIQKVGPIFGWDARNTYAVATSQDVFYLDPLKLLQSSSDLTGASHPAIVGRALGLGTGARSFVALANGTVACALGGKSLINTGLRDSNFSVDSVVAYDVNQPEKPDGPLITGLYEQDPPDDPVTRRSQRDANAIGIDRQLLEVVIKDTKKEMPVTAEGPGGGKLKKFLQGAELLNKLRTEKGETLLTAAATVLPADVSQAKYPVWRLDDGTALGGSGVTIPVKYQLPSLIQSWDAFISASLPPIYRVIDLNCEGKLLRVHAYPDVNAEKEIDLSPVTTKLTDAFETFSQALKAAGAVGPVPVSGDIKVGLAEEAKLTFAASFVENPESNLVMLAPSVEVVQDPLLSVTGRIILGKEVPNVGAAFLFVEVSGKVALRGKIDRSTTPPRVGAWGGELSLTGTVGLGVGGKAAIGSGYNSSTPLAIEMKAAGSVTSEGVVRVNAKTRATYEVKATVDAKFDGLKGTAEVTVKYLGGDFKFSHEMEILPEKKLIDPPLEAVLSEFQFN